MPLAVWGPSRGRTRRSSGRGRAGGGGASRDGIGTRRRHPLHPRADPRRAVRGCARTTAGPDHRQVAEALIALPAPDPDAVAYHLQQAGDERAAAWLVRARAGGGCLRAGDGGRAEAAMKLLDTQEADLAERGWVRLLAAALRRPTIGIAPWNGWRRWCGWPPRRGSSLGARAQALLGLLLGYGGDHSTAVATISTAADMVDRSASGDGRRSPPRTTDRQGRQPRHADRHPGARRTPY